MDKQDSSWKAGKEGKQICVTVCPVAAECLAAHYTEEYGVWGGLRLSERKRFRRQVAYQSREEVFAAADVELARQRKKLYG